MNVFYFLVLASCFGITAPYSDEIYFVCKQHGDSERLKVKNINEILLRTTEVDSSLIFRKTRRDAKTYSYSLYCFRKKKLNNQCVMKSFELLRSCGMWGYGVWYIKR